MRNKFCYLLVLSCFIVGGLAQNSVAAPKARAKNVGCSSVISLPNGKFIYKNSAPLRAGGIGSRLVGYRVEPTLIMNDRNYSSRGSTRITDSNGKVLGGCPWADAHGHAGGRWRCSMNTRNLRRQAIKNTKSPTIFIRYKGTSCVKIPDAGRCYGSVKGLCNQTLS